MKTDVCISELSITYSILRISIAALIRIFKRKIRSHCPSVFMNIKNKYVENLYKWVIYLQTIVEEIQE